MLVRVHMLQLLLELIMIKQDLSSCCVEYRLVFLSGEILGFNLSAFKPVQDAMLTHL